MVVIGTVFVDVKGYPSETYIPGGRNKGEIEYVHGGVARNIVEDIANIELKPTFIATVDDTGSGEDVINKLNKHKVNTKYMRKVPDGMGTWLAIFNNAGDVEAAISKRPKMDEIYQIILDHGDEIFQNARSILLELDMDKSIVKKTFELAEKYNKPVYAVVSNMTIALERRDYLQRTDCFVCNQQEAGLMFYEDYENATVEQLMAELPERIKSANIPCMIVTLGEKGAIYATSDGQAGYCPAQKVDVRDTTGAGDAFFSGVSIGLTYGKTLAQSCEIGSKMAASVITTFENVCPRFLPGEFGIETIDE